MDSKIKRLLMISSALSILPTVVMAQSASSGPLTVDEVIVTTTRRQANVQDVAGTVEVATAAKLEALSVTGAQGLERLAPGIAVSVSGGVNAFIRGVGTPNAGNSESSVGFYIDGIYLPNSAGALNAFNNVDRVEVLKGPQGTLYGRNTTGGLINVITRNPGSDATFDASVSYGNYDTFTQKFYGSVPLGSSVSANLAVFHDKQGKGWTENVFTGNTVQKSEETGAYGKLEWNAGPDTTVTLSHLYMRTESNKGWGFAIVPGTFGIDGTPYLGEYKLSARSDPKGVYRLNMTALRVDHEFSFAKFFSLTAYQRGGQFASINQNGVTGQPRPGQSAQLFFLDYDSDTISQEFQLSSNKPDSRFEWIVGAFYYDDEQDSQAATASTCVGAVCAPLPGNLPPQLTSTKPTTLSYSVYGDGTYHITPTTHFTVGLRYTDEKKGYSGLVTPLPGRPNSAATLPASVIRTPQAAGLPPSVKVDKVTYRIVLAQDLSEDVRAYASVNTGFKSGAYNPLIITGRPVLPETMTAYEVGLKSDLFDRRLRLNVAAFYFEWENLQLRSSTGLPVGSQPVTLNVGAVESKGIDAQFDFRASEELSVYGGLGLLDAKYKKYPGAACTTPVIPTGTVLGGLVSRTCDLSGARLPLSPKVSFNLGFNYTAQTSFGSVTLAANDSFKSDYHYPADGSVVQKAHHIVDGAITWRSPDGKFDVQLFGKNLTGKYFYQAAQNASTYVYVPGAPRTYGITLGYHY